MKKNYLFILFIGIALFIGCSEDTEPIDNYENFIIIDIDDGTTNEETNSSGDVETDLIAGQYADSGNVTATEVNGNLDITYNTEGDWVLVETHLYVGTQADMPANNPGNPRIGQFPYATEHDAGTTTYTYSDLWEIPQGECIWVAAHAVVYNTVTGEEETAWANGEDIDGNSWAMWFEVCNN